MTLAGTYPSYRDRAPRPAQAPAISATRGGARNLALLATALAAYSFGSSPTPDRVGPWELLVALCLIGYVRWAQLVRHATEWRSGSSRLHGVRSSALTMTALLLVGLVRLVPSSNSMVEASRDLVSIAFLFGPVFFAGAMAHGVRRSPRPASFPRAIAHLFGLAGCVFAVRHLVDAQAGLATIGYRVADSKEFLAQEPLVLFAAIFFATVSIEQIARGRTLIGFAYAAGTVLPLLALGAKGYRAPLAVFALSLAMFLATFAHGRLRGILAGLGLVGLSLWLLPDQVSGVIGLIAAKNQELGFNARDVELLAIWAELDTPSALILGQGLGSSFFSIAAGGAYVNFAHFSIAYALLKAGIIGATLVAGYAAGLLRLALSWRHRDRLLMLSCLGPMIVGFAGNDSFRYLGFALISSLFVLVAQPPRFPREVTGG